MEENGLPNQLWHLQLEVGRLKSLLDDPQLESLAWSQMTHKSWKRIADMYNEGGE